jgi:hypothetical protein
MQTLIDRIDAVCRFASQLKQVSTERARFQQIQTRANQLEQASIGVQKLTRSLSLMKSEGLSVEQPRLSKELKAKPLAMLEAFRADSSTLLEDGQFSQTFKAPLEAYSAKLQAALAASWKAYAESVVPPINERTLVTLEAAGLKRPVEQLRILIRDVRAIQTSLPDGRNAIVTLCEMGKQAKEVWSELEKVPPIVLTFLTKASRREATYLDLTHETVQNWLADKSLLQHLRISLAQ